MKTRITILLVWFSFAFANGQAIVDDPKITADMGIIYNGVGVRNNVTDPFNHYNGQKNQQNFLRHLNDRIKKILLVFLVNYKIVNN